MKEDKLDFYFKWLVSILIIGGALFGLGYALYYKYFWQSNEFFSGLDRLSNILLGLTCFGFFGFLSYFIIELWED